MRNITKRFGKVTALSNVNLKVREGEVHALVGENGAGKSTLMNVLSGIYPYGSYEGDIIFDGNTCEFHGIRDSEEKGIVIIHQELALVPFLSIAENLFLGNERTASWSGKVVDWPRTYKRASELLELVGLHEDPRTLIKDIGVGKQQLVEIAKAIAKNVRLLILDEPTASLNETDSQQLLDLLADFRTKGMTSIINEHFSASSVKRWKLVGDHEIVLVGALNGGKGIIFVCGTGSIALGRDNDGSYVRAGGWGHLIGDEGSGYGLGRDAFFAVTKDIDGYGCHTVLTNLIAQKLGLVTQDDIISYVYSGDKSSVAALAPIVEEAYKAGDEIAIQIVRKNAEAAVDIIECVARKMRLESGKVAMHGGLVSHETSMYHEIISCMNRRMPGFSCIHPEKDSLQGALLLAREMLAE